MSGFAYRVVLSLAALAAALPAHAQQPAPPKIVWNLGWQDNQCTLTTGSKDLGLSLWLLPGDQAPDLYVLGVPRLLPPQFAKGVTVTLLPGGETFQGEVFMRPQGYQLPVIPITHLGEDFLAAFAKSEELRLVTQKGSVTIPIRGASKAMLALNECRDVRLQEWGIDPKAFANVKVQPSPLKKNYITADDYPRAAMDKNESGTVVARLNLDPQGKVVGCAVVVSSRSGALDSTTCSILAHRARYGPAIGPDGRPSPAVRVVQINWWLAP